MNIEGGKELSDCLLALPDKVSNKIMTKALRAGGEQVVAEMRALAPSKTGALVAGITMQVSNACGEKSVLVGPGSDQYYGNMLENGTHKKSAFDLATGKKRIRGGNNGGWRMKPHPFAAKALENSQGAAIDAVSEVLGEGIEQAFQER